MKIDPDEYRVRPGEAVDLAQQPTLVATLCKSDKQCAARLQKQVEHLSDLQQLLYAANRQAVLLIFRAMDAAGKDGAIQHVMSGVNPQGCQVFSFKRNCSMIFCGAPRATCPSAGASASSTARTTKKC